jgi:hypothetical protein
MRQIHVEIRKHWIDDSPLLQALGMTIMLEEILVLTMAVFWDVAVRRQTLTDVSGAPAASNTVHRPRTQQLSHPSPSIRQKDYIISIKSINRYD